MPYTVETVVRVWDDKSGERVEVSPDRDGLDLVELRYYTDDCKIGSSMTLPAEQAHLVALAMLRLSAKLMCTPVSKVEAEIEGEGHDMDRCKHMVLKSTCPDCGGLSEDHE